MERFWHRICSQSTPVKVNAMLEEPELHQPVLSLSVVRLLNPVVPCTKIKQLNEPIVQYKISVKKAASKGEVKPLMATLSFTAIFVKPTIPSE